MSENLEFLLSDEFVEFSQKISEVHARKKAKSEEMKKIYEGFKEEIKVLEDEAKGILKDWEAWKNGQGKISTPTPKVEKAAVKQEVKEKERDYHDGAYKDGGA